MFRTLALSATFVASTAVLACFGIAAEQPAPRLDFYGDSLPPGAIARLGTLRYRADGSRATGLAISPDGKTVAVAGESTFIYFFDAATGKRIRDLNLAPLRLIGFAIAPDFKRLAVACGRVAEGKAIDVHVRIVNIGSGKVTRTIARDVTDMGGVSLAFTPDGRYLASLGQTGVVRIEDVESGEEVIGELVQADNSPRIAVSPDGGTVAISTGQNASRYYLWDWKKGGDLRELKAIGPAYNAASFAFSPDGKHIAATFGNGEFQLQVWEVASGKLRYKRGERLSGYEPPPPPFYSTDGKTLAAAGRQSGGNVADCIHQWDAASGEYRGRQAIGGSELFTISANGETLAASQGPILKVWKWPSCEAIDPIVDAHHFQEFYALAATNRGELVTGSLDGTIRVWDAASGKQKKVLRHEGLVCGVAVSPDGGQLVSSSQDDTVRLWDIESGREIYRLPGHKRLGAIRRPVAFSADGAHFSSFGDDMLLRTYDVKNGRAIREHRIRPRKIEIDENEPNPFEDKKPRLEGSVLSADGAALGVSMGGLPILFDAVSGKELRRFDLQRGPIIAFALSSDHRLMLVSAWGVGGGPNGEPPIAVWDTETGELVTAVKVPSAAVRAAAFSRDGKRFAAGLQKPSQRIAIYDSATGKEQQAFEELSSTVESLCFSHDGKLLISGMGDATALVWEIK